MFTHIIAKPNAGKDRKMASKYSNITFKGFRRENGRVGVRNHVLILPVDDISNAACEAVANNVKGTMAIPHAYGRLQFGEDLEVHFRTMIGTGSNANVHSVVVIGMSPKFIETTEIPITLVSPTLCANPALFNPMPEMFPSQFVLAKESSVLSAYAKPATLVNIASKPVIDETAASAQPALLVQGFINNSVAPAEPAEALDTVTPVV